MVSSRAERKLLFEYSVSMLDRSTGCVCFCDAWDLDVELSCDQRKRRRC